MIDEPINTFKTLDSVFGTNPTPVKSLVPVSVSTNTEAVPAIISENTNTSNTSLDFPATSELMDDYQKSRMVLRNMLDKGEHCLDNMLQIAVQTESARSFEVASNMIKMMSEVARDLVGLHEATNKAKKKSDDSKQQSGVVNNTQNNVVFQGSTTDLFNMIGK
jgi:formyltetrahydrofolate hydrolase